jgi:hypothetical protein
VTEDLQQKALDSLNKEISMPAWAVATIGILNALVTIVLALGINLGDIVDQKIKASTQIEQKLTENSGSIDKTAVDTLANVLNKMVDQTNLRKVDPLEKEINDLKREVVRLKASKK